MLAFYPKNVHSNTYFQDLVETFTDYNNIDAKFYYNFYQGIELRFFEEVRINNSIKIAYMQSSFLFALIQHINKTKNLIDKIKMYDDQLNIEEDSYYYRNKNNWKLKIEHSTEIIMKINVMLINSESTITEKIFKYDVNNKIIVLKIEFENNEIRYIIPNFDFSQNKQIIYVEELYYYKTKLEIKLISCTPIIYFDLNQLSFNNDEISLIASPILDSNDIYSFEENKEIKTQIDESMKNWTYLIYHFKTDLKYELVNEKLYIMLSSKGYCPLNVKEEFINDVYLLEFNQFSFEDEFLVFYIPFIRNRDFKKGDEILILSIFSQPLQDDSYCPSSFRFSKFISNIPTGCVEKNLDFDSPLILTAFDDTGTQYITTKLIFEQNTFAYVNLFYPKIDGNCVIARIPNIFPDDLLSINIDIYLIDALVSYSINTIKIHCDRCSGIFHNGDSYESNENHEISIKIISDVYSNYYAICSSNDGKYFIQSLQMNPDKITLISRPMIGTFTELNYLENFRRFPNSQSTIIFFLW